MVTSAAIYLASQSQRRRELLQQIGVDFDVLDINVDERRLANEPAPSYVERLALAKVRAGRQVMSVEQPRPVLGADTIVVAGDEVLGKPRDRADAVRMLQLLSGRTHQVMTAVAVVGVDEAVRLSTSNVTFRTITAAESLAYQESGEPADKAGGYAVQGLAAVFVSCIEGSYSGVMGLPLFETAALLQVAGVNIIQYR